MSHINTKSQLAKLLAKENITIRHGEYKTAFFDVENRVLGLPFWKDMGKDLYDLFVGHEIGHALYTPAEGWHESIVDLKLPRSYVNVIEDIRIEKKVQRTYPGLVPAFLRGYRTLVEDNFFGTKDRDLSSYKLIDRINIKSKTGQSVPFNEEETALFVKAMNVEYWEDVLEVCAEILAYTKENESNKQPEPETQENDLDQSQMPGMGDEDDDSGVQEDSEQASDQSDVPASGSEEAKQNEESSESEGDQSSAGVPDGKTEEEPETAETDEAFRGNEDQFLEDMSHAPTQVRDLTDKQIEQMTTGFKEVMEKRDMSFVEGMIANTPHRYGSIPEDFKAFMKETKGIVNVMAKEFEMRKAAYQYSRAKTSKTGSIDPTKLYSYKYNEDIFNRVTQLADAKSHGLVMYVDNSGSMYGTMHSVYEQLICLTQFCRKVNVPFEVHSFTTARYDHTFDRTLARGDIESSGVVINEILSSKMKKREYNQAIEDLYKMGKTREFEGVDAMGATPLNETIIAAHKMVPAFQKRHGVQKVTTVFLTDGEASSMAIAQGNDAERGHLTGRRGMGYAINVNGKSIRFESRVQMSTDLLKSLREATGSNVVGFFVPENRREARTYIMRRNGWDSNDAAKKLRGLNKEKAIKLEEFGGYEELYVMAGSDALKVDSEKLEVKEDAKKGDITKAFKKFANSKKSNRMIMSSFAKKVA